MKQPSAMSCWATVYAMMLSWKNAAPLTLDSATKVLGDPWETYFIKDSGLPPGKERDFVIAAGLREEPPANYTLQWYIDKLRDHGPLWIVTGNGISSHARLMIGIQGDKSYQRSEFIFIDPQSGNVEMQRALDFVNEFEREARFMVDRRFDNVQLRWQVIHW